MTNAKASATPSPHHELSYGSRFSARWRILGWLLVTVAVGLAAVVITVSSALEAAVASQANDDITQELQEFHQFASEGVNPETAAPFTSFEPLIDVYLRRQRAGTGEIMLGFLDNGSVVHQVRGPSVPADSTYDVVADPAAMATLGSERSGILSTKAGEFRWAKVEVVTSSGEKGSFIVGIYTQPGYDGVANTTNLMILVSLGALLIAALIGWVIAGQILQPIRTMRQTAAQISQEDLTRRIPVHGRDDLADLAQTFNDMLQRLETAFSTQQQFIDDAGHELRTPITIIRGHLELLGDDPVSRAATVQIVTQELDRMSRIVTDLLALAKSQLPDFIEIDPSVDVAELTLDIDSKVQALAPRRWILTHIADGTAALDVQRVTQAMMALAHNAVQHTNDGDEIRISSSFLNDYHGNPCVQFTITDTGPGVPPEEIETIFDRFARGTAARTSGHRSGAGLGLAIVRAIAEGHHGRVYVNSPPGEGATFALILPRGSGHDGLADDVDEHAVDSGLDVFHLESTRG